VTLFSAKLPTPGGGFYISTDSKVEAPFVWKADDEDAPPHVWGWQTLDQAEVYFAEILKVIRLAQEARRHGR